MLHADLRFPSQQEWQRKEQLYIEIIDLLDKSKLWEFAIPICKELTEVYENRVIDYTKLSSIHYRLAGFYKKILTEFRPEPEYYMVGFYGLSFPLFVRNKQFIYRGQDYEKISDFTARLCKEFPEATLVNASSPPWTELKEMEEQSLSCRLVRPIPQVHFHLKEVKTSQLSYTFGYNTISKPHT